MLYLNEGYNNLRFDARNADEKRKVNIITDYTKYAAGSVLIEMGDTKVLCTASVEDGVPPFLRGSGKGWVTAEYSMLPSATAQRNKRDISKLKQAARSVEIQRLIGRSLRSVVDFEAMPEICITVDCDVIQADGGTRTASITGGYIAMVIAMKKLLAQGKIKYFPVENYLSAISVGLVDGEALLDLCYQEDSHADVDMNVIMDSKGGFAEIQGTGEGRTFNSNELTQLLALAKKGNDELMSLQKEILGDIDKLPHFESINKILIASNNQGKIKELGKLLEPLKIEVVCPKDIGLTLDVEENGVSFEENSMLKAKAFMQASGYACVADDSGLCVDALNGEPGIYSARYCDGTDADRTMYLLDKMKDEVNRKAHFTSAISFCAPDKRSFTVTGKCFGTITKQPQGENGFGYDPVFYIEEYDKTFGQLDESIKNQISHRANSMKEFYKRIKNYVK